MVIVVAVTNTDAKSAAHGISLFLVEDGMPGFKKGRKLEKIGLKAQVKKKWMKIAQLFIPLSSEEHGVAVKKQSICISMYHSVLILYTCMIQMFYG